MRLFLIAVLTFFILFPVQAAKVCESEWALHDRLVKQLKKQYNEDRIGIGITNTEPIGGGLIMELYSAGKSWTIIATRPDGCSMPIVSGTYWQTFKPQKGKPL